MKPNNRKICLTEYHLPCQITCFPEMDIPSIIDVTIMIAPEDTILQPLQAIAEVKDAKSIFMLTENQTVTPILLNMSLLREKI